MLRFTFIPIRHASIASIGFLGLTNTVFSTFARNMINSVLLSCSSAVFPPLSLSLSHPNNSEFKRRSMGHEAHAAEALGHGAHAADAFALSLSFFLFSNCLQTRGYVYVLSSLADTCTDQLGLILVADPLFLLLLLPPPLLLLFPCPTACF